MQPKKQLKVQYIGIFEEIDSFYWPKMHFLKEGQKIRRKTGKCIHEADVVKIMSGEGIENILMDLRQFLYRNLEA